MMKRVVFLGAKKIGRECLEELFKRQEELDFSIVGVLSSPRGELVREFAKAHHLKLLHSLEDLLSVEYEILLSVQYHEILKECHIATAKEIAFNLHLAPLPEYRGCNQFSFAIMNEDRKFGVTIHRLESGIDSGDIAFERRFIIPKDCFVDTLVSLANIYGVELFCESLPLMIKGGYELIPQSSIQATRREFHLREEIDQLKCVNLCEGGGR